MIKYYTKKPLTIEAIQWTGNNLQEIDDFISFSATKYGFNLLDESMFIETMEGKMTAQKGDYIIQGVKGEFYPCKPDIFEVTYDEVSYLNNMYYETNPTIICSDCSKIFSLEDQLHIGEYDEKFRCAECKGIKIELSK
jgi:hypothetical protein